MGKSNQNVLQMVKFTLFSISAGIVQTVVFTALTELVPLIFNVRLGYWACYLPSLVLSVLWNFTFNRKFTFQSATNVPIAMLKVLGYYAVFTPVSTWLGNWAYNYFNVSTDSLGDYIILAVTMICNLVTEYLFYKFVVFRKKD